MWYNFDPNLEQNPLTYHAGCPVLKGHKWIVNKWIWTAGNMFLRPCGLNPNSTHLDVEHFLFSRK
ncbi:hypothetical protein V1264_021443 [Littorina saxatilis]|uniref:Prolyl 4-hydroxylase alpha subunit Fe(2+) 2OG dioxygenase domain-containing protein n=2 Tax=Littorina saxatilis TaxID=31220 RepID=A0AAN9AI72_9CAEN